MWFDIDYSVATWSHEILSNTCSLQLSSFHSQNMSSLVELRHRQEMIMRNQMAMAPQILAQGQQRIQGVPTQFEPRFMERCVSEFTLKSKTIVLWGKKHPWEELKVLEGRRYDYFKALKGKSDALFCGLKILLVRQKHTWIIFFLNNSYWRCKQLIICLSIAPWCDIPFSIRELVPPSEMVASDARQMHMGPHLGPPLPPHASVLPGRAFPGAGEHSPIHIHSLSEFPACPYRFKECEWALTARFFLSFSQPAMASCPRNPWKQLPGDRNSFTSKI